MRNLEVFRAEYLWILGVRMENKPPFILLKPQWTLPNNFQPRGARDKMLDGALDSLLSHHLSLGKDRYAWNINYGLWTDSPLELLVHTSMVGWMLSDPCGNVWFARDKGSFPSSSPPKTGAAEAPSGCGTKEACPLPCPCLCLLLMTICTMVPEACCESMSAPRWLLAPGKRGRPPACRLGGGS